MNISLSLYLYIYMSISLSIYIHAYICVYVYIYIYRERERESDREPQHITCMLTTILQPPSRQHGIALFATSKWLNLVVQRTFAVNEVIHIADILRTSCT